MVISGANIFISYNQSLTFKFFYKTSTFKFLNYYELDDKSPENSTPRVHTTNNYP